MKRTILILAGFSGLIASGCTSSQSMSSAAPQSPVALSQFSDPDEMQFDGSGIFHLGAGDMLGRDIFVNYLAYYHTRDDKTYATGSNPDPLED